MKKHIYITALSVLFINSVLFAVEGDGGYAGAFLRMGVGARAIGMGNAFTSLADDVTAIYWNPAAISLVNKIQVGIMYGSLSYNQHFGFSGTIIPFQRSKWYGSYQKEWDGLGAIAVGILYLRIGDIDGRDENGLTTENFSDNEMAILVSYGKSFMGQIVSVGATAKYLYHLLAENSSKGFGFDLGVLGNPIPNLRFGLVAQDILSSLTWDTASQHKDKFPLSLRGGVSYSIPLQFRMRNYGRSKDSAQKVTVAFDITHNLKEDSIHPHAGVEAYFSSFLGVRIGYDNGRFTAGLSIFSPKTKRSYGRKTQYGFELDYAFSTSEYGNRHLISVEIDF